VSQNRCCCLGVIKREFTYCYIRGSGGIDEMASREILEYVIELLTIQMKLENTTLKLTREEFQQTQESLETLEKEQRRGRSADWRTEEKGVRAYQ